MCGFNLFNIDDVAKVCGIELLRPVKNGEAFAVCPFCGDRRGKFSYVIQKGNKENLFNCFRCGEHGGMIDLYIKTSACGDYSGSDGRKKAAREIFKALGSDSAYEENHRKVAESVQKVEEVERASDEAISTVYYALLNELTLKDRHKSDLIRRGLSEEDIKRFRFRSTPEDDERFTVCKKLVKAGYKFEGVPGFYVNKRGYWDMKLSGSGYFCPVFDGEKNLIVGFQIRVDEPKNGGKYLWFSSSGKEKGTGSGAVSTFLPGANYNNVVVTEGILKATVVYSLLKGAVSVIGVPGVKSIKGIDDYLNRFNPDLAYVSEAYDMDKAIRTEDEHEREKTERLAADARKLREKISEFGLHTHSLTWDFDKEGLWKEGGHKGLDDFLLDYDKKDLFTGYLTKLQQDSQKVLKYFYFAS